MDQQNMFDTAHHFPDMTDKPLGIDLGILGDDENHSNKSVIDFIKEAPPSGGYVQDPNQRPKKETFRGPTQDQTLEMEAFFGECRYPNDEQKNELANRLSLAPSQVKFWFQKKQYELKLESDMFDTHNFEDMAQKTPEYKSSVILGDDEVDSNKSGTDIVETPSGGYDQVSNQRLKKRSRHSQLQIQELEAFFYECPLPNDKQKKELSSRLSLEPLQVKFWFQNKRTQVKAKLERLENMQLRAENKRLRADNTRCREALSKATCPFCGFSADMSFGCPNFTKIQFEQEHLKREISETPEETGTIVDLDFGWSKGLEIGNNAPMMNMSETGNSHSQPDFKWGGHMNTKK